MRKTFIFFTLLFAIIQTSKAQVNSKIWTKKYESDIYQASYIEADTLFTKDADKVSFAKYCVQKIKQEFPNGLEAVPEKKRNKMLYDISFNYAYSSKNIELKKMDSRL